MLPPCGCDDAWRDGAGYPPSGIVVVYDVFGLLKAGRGTYSDEKGAGWHRMQQSYRTTDADGLFF